MISVIALMAALGAAPATPPTPTGAGVGPTIVVTAPPKPKSKPNAPADTDVEVDDEDISEQYGPIWPEKAYGYKANGRVVLACRINSHGLAQSCTVASEYPPNMGFASAALQVQPTLKLPPPAGLTEPGTKLVRVAINFTAPTDQLDGSSGSGGPIGSISATAGSGVSARTGNPIIMKSITMMEHPIWVAAPNFVEMRRAWPGRASVAEGFVALRCEVDRAGALTGCAATKELPDNQGFEKAALSLAPLFRVAPDVMVRAPRNSKPIQVVVPIRFVRPDGGEQTVSAPSWVSGFDPDAAPKLFPPEAIARGLTTGRGVARCVVGQDGSLTDCHPEKGDPDGIGFSEAAVVLAATMKMNLWSADAGPVRGGVVRVPIRLNLAPTQKQGG